MNNFKIDYENLPVYKQKQRILDALATNQVIVVESNTGSGKTTQIPIILYEAGYTKDFQIIGMTQPRRIAAFSISDVVSAQISYQFPDAPPDFVRYKIRFDDKTTVHSQIKIMTDGILLQEIKHDKLLSAYSVLVIDEAHERSLNIDFIMGLLYNILQQRSDLKVIISSATINTQKFSDFFDNAPVISIDAPMYPVEIRYLPALNEGKGGGNDRDARRGHETRVRRGNGSGRGGRRGRDELRGEREGGRGGRRGRDELRGEREGGRSERRRETDSARETGNGRKIDSARDTGSGSDASHGHDSDYKNLPLAKHRHPQTSSSESRFDKHSGNFSGKRSHSYKDNPQSANSDSRSSRRSRGGSSNSSFGNSNGKIDDTLLVNHIVDIVEQSLANKEGDMLIFMSGEKNIKNCIDKIAQLPNAAETVYLLPLYSRLDQQAQEQVFFPAPEGKTKIIVSTNIAETSITIDNITVVIDSGRVKLNYFHYHKLTSTLVDMPISKASATQRKGRAGRTRPGICYRIYTEEEYNAMEEFTSEEILRTDLSEIVLRMAHLEIVDFENFRLVSAPPKEAITSAVALLQDMSALDSNKLITKIGNLMIAFPLSPTHARILVEAMEYYPEVLSKVIIILSFLTTPNPFLLPLNEEIDARRKHNSFSTNDSDFFSYITLFETYTNTPYEDKPTFCENYYLDLRILNEIVNIHTQLSDMVVAHGVFVGKEHDEEKIIKSMLKGLMYNVCVQLKGSTYLNRTGEKVYIHPGSMMFDARKYPPIVMAGEIIQTSKIFARSLTECRLNWIQHTIPYLFKELKQLMPLISNPSHLAQQKLKTKLASPKTLFSISANSILDKPERSNIDNIIVGEKQRDTTNSITLAKRQFTLMKGHDKKHKVISLNWQDVIEIMDYDNLDEIKRHGTLRCDISYNVHAVLYNIKLLNVPILFTLYGESLPFTPNFKQAISIENLKKKQHVLHAKELLDHVMHILVPPSTSKKTPSKHHKHKQHGTSNVYKFLALYMNELNEIALVPEGGFIQALQTSLYTLGSINKQLDLLSVPIEVRQQIGSLYSRLRHAFDISENY